MSTTFISPNPDSVVWDESITFLVSGTRVHPSNMSDANRDYDYRKAGLDLFVCLVAGFRPRHRPLYAIVNGCARDDGSNTFAGHIVSFHEDYEQACQLARIHNEQRHLTMQSEAL